jgi:hypothetical protein
MSLAHHQLVENVTATVREWHAKDPELNGEQGNYPLAVGI